MSTPLQINVNDVKSALEDIVRRINSIEQRLALPTSTVSAPKHGAMIWSTTNKIYVYNSATGTYLGTSALT